jgi:aryl-alcohol dehydrogenase-like predicted oxidoreductase
VPARAETQGRTEEFIGSWLAAGGRRDQVILATKASGPGERFGYIRGGPRLNRKHLTEAIEGSLRRLRTDYIDLYQLHWPERETNYFGRLGYEYRERTGIPIEETLEALGDLIREGKIRHVGVSNETPWGVAEYLTAARQSDLPRIVSIQNPYNLLNRTFEVGLAEFAHREHVGLLAYSPLAMGALSGKYLGARRPKAARLTLFPQFERYSSPRCQVAIQAYVDVANRHDLDPAQMALAFVNSRPFVTSSIIGATTLDQLKADVDSADQALSPDVVDAIEAIHRREPNPAP